MTLKVIEVPPAIDRLIEYRTASAPPGPAPPSMVWIPGGTFRMGSDRFYPEEGPVRETTVAGFWMDATPVTTAQFAAFVAATGHVTSAERPIDPAGYPGAAPSQLTPSGLVFRRTDWPVPLDDPRQWWRMVPGATWRRPHGPDGPAADRRHPVVQVSFVDALAYAAWAGKTIPTEAEWEFAARGGLDGAVFAWGNRERDPNGRPLANHWQGRFPHENTLEDGFEFTSPVKSFPANGYGLFDVTGNVWEWTTDRYRPVLSPPEASAGQEASCCLASGEQDPLAHKVIKGGSHLCAPNHCFRFRPAARSFQAADTPTSHIGFRCIIRP